MATISTKKLDSELLACLLKGDREAFASIYSKYWYKLFLIAHKRLKNKEISEEIVQDLFVNLWEKRDSLQIQYLENYLVRSMKYMVIDHIRLQIVRNNYLEYYHAFVEQDELQTENTVAVNDLSNVLEKGLKTLPEKSREVFVLSRMESWPVSQIASHLQISEKGVEYHLTKSIKTLRIYLKEFAITALIIIGI